MLESLENHVYYQHRIEESEALYLRFKKKHQLIGTLRLLVFVAMAAATYFLWGNFFLLIALPLLFAGFLYLIHRSVDSAYMRDKQQKITELNKEELNVLNGNWLHFNEGSEYKNSKHAFSHDMDLFGAKSIFQLLNRTVSRKGSNLLAHQLQEGNPNVDLSNQAIRELSRNVAWCQEFIAEGMIFNQEKLHRPLQAIQHVAAKETFFQRMIRITVPFASAAMTLLFAFNVIPVGIFGAYIAIVLSFVGRQLKNTNAITAHVTSFDSQVKMFQRQLTHYKTLRIESAELASHRDALFSSQEGLMEALKDLERIQNRMDSRMNLLVGIVLNFFLAWDFQVLHQWERWRTKNSTHLGAWEEQLAQIEVWISGAVYHFNFPETTFAQFVDGNAINIEGLGHPFVPTAKRVVNDVRLTEEDYFLIITGPNMAGKSTYLRSLGCAFICANAGFPVLATRCAIPKMKLYSSMRTSDDLTVESSYFHAELSRLRFIADAIESGEKVFVILDEILKGTNSKDKELGSAKFLQKLHKLNAKGVIATHDLSLCELSNNSSAFKNWYFDSTIHADSLSFDYRIREGICQNMNALFLLKLMRLVD